MTPIEQILDISIKKLMLVHEMTKLIKTTESKENTKFVLQSMIDELSEGLIEIEDLLNHDAQV